jgi:hypothetical protein
MELINVVCHFQEDISWVKKLNHPYIIYNKNEKNNHLFIHNLPNVGYDAIVYLKYIIDNYDNLPDYVCFLEDNPFDHCPSAVELINKFKFDVDFFPLGRAYIRDNEDILSQTINYANSVGIEYNEPIKFINAAQCIVSKNLIMKRSKESYQRIKDSIPAVILSDINYFIEYLWPTILNFNNALDTSFCEC